MLFDVTETRAGGRTVLSIIGDVDLATLPELASRMSRIHGGDLVVDLSSVDHFDPLCFGVLISARLRSERSGSRFAVVSPGGRCRELLKESRLDSVLEVIESLDDL